LRSKKSRERTVSLLPRNGNRKITKVVTFRAFQTQAKEQKEKLNGARA
jgi:hypothetical protein